MKKELQDRIIALHKEAEEIRTKYNGKTAEMPGDELERWTKCLDDADKADTQLKNLEREEKQRESVEKVEDVIDEVSKAKGGPATQEAKAGVIAWGLKMAYAAQGMSKSEIDTAVKAALQTKGLTVGSQPGGSYFLLPLEIANEIIITSRDAVFVRKYSRAYTVTQAESLGIITMGDIDDFSWTDELNTGNEDTTEPFGRRELSPKPLAKRIKVSKKLMRMSQRPEQELLGLIDFVKSRTEEKGFLLGTGANQPLGVLVASTDGISTGRDVTAGAANAISGDDFINAVALMKAWYRNGLRWAIHRNTEARVRKLKDGQNNYIWSPFGGVGQGLQGGFAPTIVGYPYDISEYMSDPGSSGAFTTGLYWAILANWGMGHRIVDALNMELTPLYELYAANNQMGYIFRAELDAAPVDENAFARIAAQ